MPRGNRHAAAARVWHGGRACRHEDQRLTCQVVAGEDWLIELVVRDVRQREVEGLQPVSVGCRRHKHQPHVSQPQRAGGGPPACRLHRWWHSATHVSVAAAHGVQRTLDLLAMSVCSSLSVSPDSLDSLATCRTKAINGYVHAMASQRNRLALKRCRRQSVRGAHQCWVGRHSSNGSLFSDVFWLEQGVQLGCATKTWLPGTNRDCCSKVICQRQRDI